MRTLRFAARHLGAAIISLSAITLVGAVLSGTFAFADPPAAVTMKPFEDNGLALTGAEYWPYVGGKPIDEDKDILWGFYPQKGIVPPGETDPNVDTASPRAVACAEKAYAKLRTFIAHKPAKLARIVALGADKGITPKFYLWTDDYTKASTPYPGGERKNRLWYWLRKPAVTGRVAGYWKWESVVTQKGECLVPEDKQIESYLDEKLKELETAK